MVPSEFHRLRPTCASLSGQRDFGSAFMKGSRLLWDQYPPASVSWPLPCMRASKLQGLGPTRSEEHTSELQSLMRISYAVFCLKKKKTNTEQQTIYGILDYEIRQT